MNHEHFAPPQAPQGQVLDQFNPNSVLVEGLIGGDKVGGEVFIYTDNEPIVDRSEGFKVGQLPSDLLMTMDLGTSTEEKAYNTLGVVRTKLGSNNTNVEDILLVRLETDKDGNYYVPDNRDGRPSSIKLQPGKELKIGRGNQNNSEDISFLNMTADLKMSASHLTIELGEHGSVRVTDTNSTHGTDVKFMGEPEKFSHEDLAIDMEQLRKELNLGKVSVGTDVEVDSVSERKLIDSDSVPKSAEEASTMLEDSEQSRLEDKYKPVLEQLSDQLNSLTEGLSVDDMLELRAFQNGDVLIRKGWEDGGDNGIMYTSEGERSKQEAYNKMSRKAQDVAYSWSQTYSRYEEIQKIMRG